jgi:hypothetical protein
LIENNDLQSPEPRAGARAEARVADRAQPKARPVRHNAWEADRAVVAERAAGLALVPRIALAAYVMSQSRIWDARGYLRPAEYCQQRLQRSLRWLRDHAALGEALERLPHLERSLLGLDGPPIGPAVATAIGRVATAETLASWVERARRLSVREIIDEIRACRSQGRNTTASADTAMCDGSQESEAASRRTIEDPEPEVERVVEVRVHVPRTVRAIFEDVLDLHRAASGSEAPTAAFVEALMAEAVAGSASFERRLPDGSTVTSMAPAGAEADREHAFAQDTRRWADLRAYSPFPSMPENSCTSRLEEYEAMEPLDLERHFLELLEQENERERRIGRMLHEMSRHGDWHRLEFASAAHYAVERLGMGRRRAESRVGILHALRHLSVVRAAYEDGSLGIESAWCVARVLSDRRPDAALQERWVEYARRKSVKRLRDAIRHFRLRELGPEAQLEPPVENDATLDPVPEPPSANAARNPVPEPAARNNAALDPVPEPPSDEQWYAALQRVPGDSRERLRSLRLPGLDDTTGALTTLTSTDVCLRMRLPEEIAWSFLAAIDAARLRAEQVAPRVPWHEPWAQASLPSLRAAHRFQDGGQRAPAWVGLVALLEDYVETWDNPKTFPRREWDAIYQRAGFRCEAPCCMARVHLEDHHIAYRSHGGSDEPWNQLALCAAHHKQGEHGELARCRGKAPLGVIWRLGKAGYETWWANETQLEPDDPRILGQARVRFTSPASSGTWP